MPVTPDADEQAIREVATDFFARRAPVSGAEASTDWRPLHREIAELDFFAQAGGALGLGPRASGLIAEAAGRELVPGPWLDQLVAVRILAEAAPDVAESLMSGERYAALAFGGDGEIGGVRFGDEVDLWVVIDGDVAVVIERPSDTTADPSIDPLWRTVSGSVAGVTEIARADAGDALAFAGGLAAAASVGGGRRVLEDAITYVSDRRQFGVPIGTFQAIKHRAADAHVALLHARSLVYSALADADAHRLHVARVAADGAYRKAAESALQMHGGIGFTAEATVHLFLKHAHSLRAWPRPVERHLEVIASDLQLEVAA